MRKVGLVGLVWLIGPVEYCPEIALENCALERVGDLALGVSAEKFVG